MPITSIKQDDEFSLDRLQQPPPLKGSTRVPIVKNLRLIRAQNYGAGTQFTLSWEDPDDNFNLISHFNIYVTGLLSNNKQPLGPTSVRRSPVEVRVQSDAARPVKLIVQTVLLTGLQSDMELSPSVSGNTIAPQLTEDDFADESVPLRAFSPWGDVDELIAGTGTTTAPEWTTRAALDLVLGNSDLTNANRVVISDGDGSISEASFSDSDVVLGAPDLTNAGKLVLSDGDGSVSEAANLEYINGALLINAGVDFKSALIDDGDSPYTLGSVIVLLIDATAGDVTVNLPSVSARPNRTYWIKRIDSSGYTVTIAPDGSDTIEGDTDAELPNNACYTITNDGTSAWYII